MLNGDWIGRWGQAFSDKEALVDVIENRRYTYGELAGDVHRLANYLHVGLGIGFGDRVACLSLNRADYIKLFFAISRLGAILVPLNYRLTPLEFIYFLEDAAPKAIFFDQTYENTVSQFKSKVHIPFY
ncbi:MAG: AMP-binding protein, partial [Deltaproteobacteria bacterium]|nr:AMP-binding protein [Deltaproteobacteria bacterium]